MKKELQITTKELKALVIKAQGVAGAYEGSTAYVTNKKRIKKNLELSHGEEIIYKIEYKNGKSNVYDANEKEIKSFKSIRGLAEPPTKKPCKGCGAKRAKK